MIDQANIDQYTQRISDQQATIERLEAERAAEQLTAYRMSERVTELAAQVVALRGALKPFAEFVKVWDAILDVKRYDSDILLFAGRADVFVTLGQFRVALLAIADPSPQADAVRAVLEAAGKWLNIRKEGLPLVDEDLDLENVVDAYRAVTRGDGGGE